MNRTEKQSEIVRLKECFEKMTAAVLTNFQGLNVPEITALRRAFRKANVEYRVVKNTLIKKALADTPYLSQVEPFLKQMTGLALSYDDPSIPAKVLVEFIKKNEKLKIKCGLMDSNALSLKEVEQLSKLPGKNELRAQLLATFNAPATSFVRLLQAGPTSFLYLLNAQENKLKG